MNELLDFYRKFLEDGLGRVIDEDYTVNLVAQGKDDPKKVIVRPDTIKVKRLVLPVEKLLRGNTASWEGYIAFHPLCESLARGESPVLQWTKETVVKRLNMIVGICLLELAQIAASSDKELSPDMARVLLPLKDMKADSPEHFSEVIAKAIQASPSALVNIYLKRDGKIGDQNYRRVATVSFPLLEKLMGNDEKVHGVKLRKADRKNLIELYKIVFPKADVEHSYSTGSNNDVAPYFTALITAFEMLIRSTNAIIDTFSTVSLDLAARRVDIGFMDLYQAACHKYMSIPQLEGNVGDTDTPVAEGTRINRDVRVDQKESEKSSSLLDRLSDRNHGSRFGGSRFGDREEGGRFGGGRFGGGRFGGGNTSRFPSRFQDEDRTATYASGDSPSGRFGSRFGGGGRFNR